MSRIRIPYGVSNYERLVTGGYYFVDKTKYIEQLESLNERILFFLRPRKFGKSLWVSLLQHYYGIEQKENFRKLFSTTYIGKSPTPLANKYYVVKFDFSNIETDESQKTYLQFGDKIRKGIEEFHARYNIFSHSECREITDVEYPAGVFNKFISVFSAYEKKAKIFCAIDEYDHFTNELVSFNLDEFKNIVSRNGYVRKFYEAIKESVGNGIVDRFFATGVTPVTLDSMTSGFNIGSDLTVSSEFNEMLGFTGEEVRKMLEDLDFNGGKVMYETLESYYNGSLFSAKATTRMFNSNMVVNYLNEYQKNGAPPEQLIDTNIASDYAKIRNIFYLSDQHEKAFEQILQSGEVISGITLKYSFEREFNLYDFISLLFYNGLLTIKAPIGAELIFQIPNYAIKTLYWEFFANELISRYDVKYDISDVATAMRSLAYENNIEGWVTTIENILDQLSNRDYIRFDEKYIKLLFFTLAILSPVYAIKSEPEVRGEYPDLMYLAREPYKVNYQYLFELKYLPKAGKAKLATLKKEAREQVKRYLQKPEIREIANLKAYTLIFVGKKAHIEAVISE